MGLHTLHPKQTSPQLLNLMRSKTGANMHVDLTRLHSIGDRLLIIIALAEYESIHGA